MKIQGEDQLFISLQAANENLESKAVRDNRSNPELWKACQDFEGLFLSYLIKSMEKTLPEGAISSNGLPDVMFNQVMGSAMSKNGGIGLAEFLYRDLEPKVERLDTDMGTESTLHNLHLRRMKEESHDPSVSR